MDRNREKIFRKIKASVGQSIDKFSMIQDQDRIMVGLSGGKDSYTLLTVLMELKKRAPIHFDVLAVNLDQKQPGFPEHVLPEYLERINVPFRILQEDTYSIVKEKTPKGKTTCSLCSRLRRGILYRVAKEENCNKLALGHHADDILETFFLNFFYAGSLNTMPPILKGKDGNPTVIRPLAYCFEEEIAEFAKIQDYPIIPCNLCGTQEGLKRKKMKNMLSLWHKEQPDWRNSMLNALANVNPARLMDPRYLNEVLPLQSL